MSVKVRYQEVFVVNCKKCKWPVIAHGEENPVCTHCKQARAARAMMVLFVVLAAGLTMVGIVSNMKG